MEVSIKAHDKGTVISIVGKVDTLTADRLLDTFMKLIGEGNIHLVADLGQVEYVSSAGLRALLATVKETRQRGGELLLAGAAGPVHKALRLSGVLGITRDYPDVETALASLVP